MTAAKQLTPNGKRFFYLAMKAGLKNPTGRACWLVSRTYNTGRYGLSQKFGDLAAEDAVKQMTGVSAETAQRWLEHWQAGGSLKCLGRTAAQESQRRREYRAAYKARVASAQARREDLSPVRS